MKTKTKRLRTPKSVVMKRVEKAQTLVAGGMTPWEATKKVGIGMGTWKRWKKTAATTTNTTTNVADATQKPKNPFFVASIHYGNKELLYTGDPAIASRLIEEFVTRNTSQT